MFEVVIAHERLVQQNGLTSLHLTSTESERERVRERERGDTRYRCRSKADVLLDAREHENDVKVPKVMHPLLARIVVEALHADKAILHARLLGLKLDLAHAAQ